jgi:hypothetical protein
MHLDLVPELPGMLSALNMEWASNENLFWFWALEKVDSS